MTPPTSPGSWTSCSTGAPARRCSTTYEEERRPSAVAAIDFSIDLGKVICVADPAEAAARDEAMAAGYDGSVSDVPGLPGIGRGLVAAGTPHAGELFPQGDLAGRRFDDVHGVGWRLVTFDPAVGGLDPADVAWFGTVGGAVVDVADTAADLVEWCAAHDVRWALQRPDFHLFGTATDLPGAAALLAELRHRLAAPEVP